MKIVSDWYGGWTFDWTERWYKISAEDFVKMSKLNGIDFFNGMTEENLRKYFDF